MDIPGFIDLQVNGYRGVDFSSPKLSEKQFREACGELSCNGTAAFLPTLITGPTELYERNLPLMASLMVKPGIQGHALGFHIEGPFISPREGARGVHNPEWIRKPDTDYFDRLQKLADGKIRLLTIAADIEGAASLTRHAVSRGVTVSLGHHLALDEHLEDISQAGAKALTHLGNGVPMMLNRHHNPIWSGLSQDSLYAMIVTDGHHLPGSLIKVIIRAKGVEKTVVVSDASPVAGQPPGRYISMGREVILEPDGLLYDSLSGYLAGSSSNMLKCMNFLASLGILRFEELLQVGFYNPLNLIGIDPSDVAATAPIFFDSDEKRFHLGEVKT
jgi:N-acetylglucosamine-6-phosphate deacetylase